MRFTIPAASAPAASALAALLLAACSDHSHDDDVPPEDLADVIYEGGATDEALEALLAATAVDDPAQAAVVDEPTDGAMLEAATPVTVAWHIGATATGAPFPKHGTPVNGRAYFLTFESAGGDRLARVFTAELTYAPSAEVWGRFADSGGPVVLQIVNAVFEDNLIPADAGPFSGTPSTFTVVP
jgi:hypothetical protein